MVCHALPISDVSSAIIQGSYTVRLATGALELEGLVYTNDLTNSSEQHELTIGKVLPQLPRSIIRERFFDRPGADRITTLSAGILWWLINICQGYLVF